MAIVVGYDGSPGSDLALEWALEQARVHHLPLTLLLGIAPPMAFTGIAAIGPTDPELVSTLAKGANDVLDKAKALIAASPTPVDVTTMVGMSGAAASIIDASIGADMVVVGSRGHGGFKGLLLGSVSTQVAAHAKAPVVVVRGAPPAESRKVVIGIDGSESSVEALEWAFAFCSLNSYDLTVVHAWQSPSYDLIVLPVNAPVIPLEQIDADEVLLAAESLAGFGEKYPDVAVTEKVVQTSPTKALLEASADAVLLVVGTRGHGEITGALLGSTSLSVLHRAHIPVAIVHRKESE